MGARLATWLLAYLAFVVYGSLVPCELKPMSLAEAWQRFQQIQLLRIGTVQRADWISNIVLYVPVGALLMQQLRHAWPGAAWLVRAVLTMGLGCALAVGVEFTQLFFPPRTVSVNDLIAEAMGTAIGIGLATRLAAWLDDLRRVAATRTTALLDYALKAFAVAYVAYSLFPYDLVLSATELQQKLASAQWGWWLASTGASPALRLLRTGAECLLALPLGVLVARVLGPARGHWPRAVLWGAAFGVVEELAQLVLVSGVSQGVSVLTRAIGFGLGAWAWQHLPRLDAARSALALRRHTVWLVPAWLVLAALANRWTAGGWIGIDRVALRWQDLHWLPFYYHYFTTEMAALTSLASSALLYGAIGILAWAYRWSAGWTALIAALAAAVFEAGKLFSTRGHADPTNLLIAAAAAAATLVACRALAGLRRPATTLPAVAEASPAAAPPARAPSQGRATGLVLSLGILAAVLLPVLLLAAGWPDQPVLLMLAVLAAAALAWSRPGWGLALLMAALPLADFVPWTGRLHLDEFDLLCAAVLAAAHLRLRHIAPRHRRVDLAGLLALLVLLAALAASAAIGGVSTAALGTSSEYSPFASVHALRLAKGGLWAAIVLLLLLRLQRRALPALRPLAQGMAIGLAGTVAWVVWERAAFVGLLDFSSDYRVSGPFSAMNVGGAYIECYLSLATPFLVWLIVQTRSLSSRLLGLALLLATVYALMVTFSRTGYLSFALALAAMLLGAMWVRPGRLRLTLAATAAVAVLVALPVVLGPFAQTRLKSTEHDLGTRQQHWQDSSAMAAQHSPVWGAGLARFPADHYVQHLQQRHSAAYDRLLVEDAPVLRLAGGETIFIEQVVDVRPREELVLRVEARSAVTDGEFFASLCERWMLTSYSCYKLTLKLPGAGQHWQRQEWRVNTGTMAGQPWFARRTVKFALHTPPGAYTVDLRQVSLVNARGTELLDNGRFAQGMDHWYFSVGNHLQWHTKNLYLHLLYEQGWLGLAAWGACAALAGWRVVAAVRQRRLAGWLGLSGMMVWLVLGAFDSLVDTPRFLMLCLLTLGLCILSDPPDAEDTPHG
ncbi:MAG: VanZ family protein [Burkholderiales bacterium]|nr:VanZ family protein [Burkholderiales bacterium]